MRVRCVVVKMIEKLFLLTERHCKVFRYDREVGTFFVGNQLSKGNQVTQPNKDRNFYLLNYTKLLIKI